MASRGTTSHLGDVQPASSKWREALPSRGYKMITPLTQQENQHLKVRMLDSSMQLSSVSCMAISDRGYGENDIIVQAEGKGKSNQLQFLLIKARDTSLLSKCVAPGPVNDMDWLNNVLVMASDNGNVNLHRIDRTIMNGKNYNSKELNCTVYNLPSLRHNSSATPSPEHYTHTSKITRVYLQPVPSSSNTYSSGKSDDSSTGSASDSDSPRSKSRSSAQNRNSKSISPVSPQAIAKVFNSASMGEQPSKFMSLENHRFHIWQIERNETPLNSVKGSNTPLTCAAWNAHDVNQIVIGGVSHGFKILDIRALNNANSTTVSWKCDHAHADVIRDIQWNPMIPHWLATCGSDNVINIWDLRYNSGTPVIALEGHDNIVKRLSWSRFHCETLLSGGIDHCVKLWNLKVEPHYILATVSNIFNDSICGVECSRTRSMYFYGQSAAGELVTLEATPMFMSPLVYSRFNEDDIEERNAENFIYYRLLKNAFTKILVMAKKYKAENNLDKALRLLELCKVRPLPSSKIFHNDYFSSGSEAIERFKKELREYSYFLPPNAKGMNEVWLIFILYILYKRYLIFFPFIGTSRYFKGG